MEENEDEPDDVKKATPVAGDIESGRKDETAGRPKATGKSKNSNSGKSPRCEKHARKPTIVKSEADCCRNKMARTSKSQKTMAVMIYSPPCNLSKLEIVPRHCLSKKEYVDMLATPSRKCPMECLGKTVMRRVRPISDRINELAQPARRLVVGTLMERGESLPPEMISNLIKSVEGSSCLTPEQAEHYFREKERHKDQKNAGKILRKKCREKPKNSKCQSPLDREAVMHQYLMAERFVRSILKWKCPIPVEEFEDIASVILRRLSFVLEYTPQGQQEDLKSQQMRFLADIIACWISGVLFEVAEEHSKELEEEKARAEEEKAAAAEDMDDDKEEEKPMTGEAEKEEEESEAEDKAEDEEQKKGKDGTEDITDKGPSEDTGTQTVKAEEEGKKDKMTDEAVDTKDNSAQVAAEKEAAEEKARLEAEAKIKQEQKEKEQEEEERKKKEEEEKARVAAEEEEDRRKKKELEEAAEKKQQEEEEAEEERKRKEAAEEEEKKRKEAAEEEEKKRKEAAEEEEKKRKEAAEEEAKKKQKEAEEEQKLKEVGLLQAIEGIGDGKLFETELPFVTFGRLIQAVFDMVTEAPEGDETDMVQNRIQRALYEKLSRLVTLESPDALTENLKDVIDVFSGKAAAWLKSALHGSEAEFLRDHPPEVESTEIRDWGKWLDRVADRAGDWANWIHRVVNEAEAKSAGSISRSDWQSWTSDTETKAMLWRRYYLETVHQAHHNRMMTADRPVVKAGKKRGIPGNADEVEVENTDLSI
ncbi:axoneme-associated protein mst101(2)-like [Neodiprion fabricii]|uniref:axoneme-associated protein mst101(2)-like n=1 Tax=Neodiprion fabricii TaxID=2872261 RepID=UPI001ED957C5|nr:axoneme-associated protein mst101(2)-like [Neodiprion fabricii]